MATELGINEDILEGEDMLNLEDLDEKEILGDVDDEDGKADDNIVTKKELLDGDDLYDAAIEPSGTVNEKRESAEIQSSLPNTAQQKPIIVKIESSIKTEAQQQVGKRYCCYVGNMTWWTTDSELEKTIKSFGLDDLIDLKFYENRNNGQSKGFALAVFGSEASVKALMEKLPSKKLNDQSLIVLPYTKQSLAKLEEATKRPDQKGTSTGANNPLLKEEKVVNIGTIRIGPNGAPVPQLMSSINLAQLARPVIHQQTVHQPTSLLSLNFATPPPTAPGTTTVMTSIQQQPPQHGRPPQAASVGMVTTVAATMPPGTTTMLNSSMVASQQQQQQMAVMAAQQQQSAAAAAAMLMQQQQQQQQQAAAAAAAAAAIANQQQRQMGGITAPINIGQPPPSHHGSQQQQQALQQAMSRPPPNMQALGVNPTALPPMTMPNSLGPQAPQQYQPQQPQSYRQPGNQMPAPVMQQQTMQSAPGFPPGAHINPQVYPGFAHGGVSTVAYSAHAHPENGAALMSESEFQEIMTRNQTVSSSAIHRAVTDAASGDYPSAIETLVTAISLIRSSRVAHDDRCKLLINTLQDTLNGIESKSYSSGGSRKHRRDRSRSPVRTSKRHRRSHSRSRSRERNSYDYSPIRHSLSRRY